MRTHVYFNDIDLTDRFYVSDLQETLLPRDIGILEVPGMDGAVFTGVRLSPRSITLTLTVKDETMEGMRAASRLLASMLATREPAPLYLSIDSGLYSMAIARSKSPDDLFRKATRHEVEFVIPDPVKYGELRTVTVPAGGSVTFNVGGTYPTMPTVECDFTTAQNAKLWKLALEDGTYLAYEPDYDLIQSYSLAIDCPARVLMANSQTDMLTADATWLELEPGEHTLTLEGNVTSGPVTVQYRERWT